MNVYPITITKVDWDSLLTITQAALKRSIVKSLDARKIDVRGNHSSYIAALGEFLEENTAPSDILNDPGILLSFINLGFLIITDKETFFEIQNESGMRIILAESVKRDQYIGICNDSLLGWRNSIINGTSLLVTYETRLFFNMILGQLENLGFGRIFQQYKKKSQNDGTFLLT